MQEGYPSQLVHFHGVQDFGPQTESFNGTIFLFSLRGSSRSLSKLADPRHYLLGGQLVYLRGMLQAFDVPPPTGKALIN